MNCVSGSSLAARLLEEQYPHHHRAALHPLLTNLTDICCPGAGEQLDQVCPQLLVTGDGAAVVIVPTQRFRLTATGHREPSSLSEKCWRTSRSLTGRCPPTPGAIRSERMMIYGSWTLTLRRLIPHRSWPNTATRAPRAHPPAGILPETGRGASGRPNGAAYVTPRAWEL